MKIWKKLEHSLARDMVPEKPNWLPLQPLHGWLRLCNHRCAPHSNQHK